MSGTIVTGIRRTDPAVIDALTEHGVATVHEAMGRCGLVGTGLRPIQSDVRTGGNAVTVLSWPGDNLMIHAAIEQCRPGDMLVVTTTSPSSDGAFGELFATALVARGVHGLVTSTGVRDVAELRALRFPVWSSAVSAQGTVKATAGSVNVPITLGGVVVHPGDAVIADDDGIVIVPRDQAEQVLAAADARSARESDDRAAYQSGELSLDRKGLRGLLTTLGVTYEEAEDHERF